MIREVQVPFFPANLCLNRWFDYVSLMTLILRVVYPLNVQVVLDARTSHQSVLSRLVREQKEGLRDSRGSLIAGHRGSPRNPSQDTGRSSSDTSSDGGGGSDAEARATAEENCKDDKSGTAAVESSAATIASNGNGAAASEETGPGQDGERTEEGQGEGEGEGEDEEAEGVGVGGNSSKPFSFLPWDFDEASLEEMRTPPFLLPRVIISDGYVQVCTFSSKVVLV